MIEHHLAELPEVDQAIGLVPVQSTTRGGKRRRAPLSSVLFHPKGRGQGFGFQVSSLGIGVSGVGRARAKHGQGRGGGADWF